MAMGIEPKTLSSLFESYHCAIATGNRAQALAHICDLLKLTGDRPDLLAAYGNLLLENGQLAIAEDAAWRSINLDRSHDETLKLLGRIQVHAGRSHNDLKQLPASPYAKYLLPMDYPPSRCLSPRWGHARPALLLLSAILDRNHKSYLSLISELRTLVPFLRRINPNYSWETAQEPGWIGPPINAIDLAYLYYFVWKYRPSTYLEIGSGSTTSFVRRAITDHSLATRIVSIDPEPRSRIDAICDEVLRDGLETLSSLQIFADLQPGDILSMDGSHRCFMNSDVTVFFLDVLPLLKPGVIIHIHDIVLPYDYPEMFTNWYWNEQYVLAAYLMGMADRIQVLMPSAFVSATPGLNELLLPPLVDIGPPDSWLYGGSFWFTHLP